MYVCMYVCIYIYIYIYSNRELALASHPSMQSNQGEETDDHEAHGVSQREEEHSRHGNRFKLAVPFASVFVLLYQ
jgi:hypothetical protein